MVPIAAEGLMWNRILHSRCATEYEQRKRTTTKIPISISIIQGLEEYRNEGQVDAEMRSVRIIVSDRAVDRMFILFESHDLRRAIE
ncbi:hypothetical protein PSPO01_10552 [Paraphaeosphaeria sporulosa]